MVRGEGLRRRPARDRLHHRRFHLEVAARVKKPAQRAQYLRPLNEDVAHARPRWERVLQLVLRLRRHGRFQLPRDRVLVIRPMRLGTVRLG